MASEIYSLEGCNSNVSTVGRLPPRSRAVLFVPPSCVSSLPTFTSSLPVSRHPDLVPDGWSRFHPVPDFLLRRGPCDRP